MVVRVVNVSRGLVLGTCVRRADTFGSRLLGLMFRRGLAPGEGLWIEPSAAIHTHFMRFALDVVFVDSDGVVVAVFAGLKPWRQTPYVRGARACLELAAGAAQDTAPGDRLVWE